MIYHHASHWNCPWKWNPSFFRHTWHIILLYIVGASYSSSWWCISPFRSRLGQRGPLLRGWVISIGKNTCFFPLYIYIYMYIYIYGMYGCMYTLYIYIHTYTHTHTHTYIHTYVRTYIHTDRQTDIQTDRHTDRQTDRHLYIYTSNHLTI